MSVEEALKKLRKSDANLAAILEDQITSMDKMLGILKILEDRSLANEASINGNSLKLDRFLEEFKKSKNTIKKSVVRKPAAPKENILHWVKEKCLELGVVEFFGEFIENPKEIVDKVTKSNKKKIDKKSSKDEKTKCIASNTWTAIKNSGSDTLIAKIKVAHSEWIDEKRKKNSAPIEDIET